MMNQVYPSVTAEIKQFPRINNDDCIFCHGMGGWTENRAYGVGIEDPESETVSCAACWGTGKDDFELFLIMNNILVPPADGCGTTILEG